MKRMIVALTILLRGCRRRSRRVGGRTRDAVTVLAINKKRDPASDIGRFMSDAATAYAVLALARP